MMYSLICLAKQQMLKHIQSMVSVFEGLIVGSLDSTANYVTKQVGFCTLY